MENHKSKPLQLLSLKLENQEQRLPERKRNRAIFKIKPRKSRDKSSEGVVKFSQEELDYFQPDITKAMLGLNSYEKTIILKKCIIEYFKNKAE